MYWVAVVPDGGLTVSADGRHASLQLRGIPIIDQPRWPAHDATATPAILDYRIEWTATGEAVTYRDATKQYVVTGWRATTRIEASVQVPSTGFKWHSDPIETSSAAFGVIGTEMNGRYFDG